MLSNATNVTQCNTKSKSILHNMPPPGQPSLSDSSATDVTQCNTGITERSCVTGLHPGNSGAPAKPPPGKMSLSAKCIRCYGCHTMQHQIQNRPCVTGLLRPPLCVRFRCNGCYTMQHRNQRTIMRNKDSMPATWRTPSRNTAD